MRTIKIGFSKSKKKFAIFSWLIRLFDKSEFSHVFIKWNMKSGKPIIYQASGHTVNFVGNKRFEIDNQIVYEFDFEIEDDQFDKFLDWAVDESGAPYSIRSVIGIAIAKLFKLKKNPLGGSDSFICSKLAGYFFDVYIADMVNDNQISKMTPKDVYKLCIEKTKAI